MLKNNEIAGSRGVEPTKKNETNPDFTDLENFPLQTTDDVLKFNRNLRENHEFRNYLVSIKLGLRFLYCL